MAPPADVLPRFVWATVVTPLAARTHLEFCTSTDRLAMLDQPQEVILGK
jgi:hypothetical protein